MSSPGPTSHSAPLTLRCSDDLRDGSQETHLVFYIVIITENRKHPSSPECLVSVQKVMEGSELELAKVPVENKTGGGERVAPEGPAEGPSLNLEVVGALFLSLWRLVVGPGSHLAEA